MRGKIVSRFGSWIKGRYSFVPVIAVILLMFCLSALLKGIAPIFEISREKATDLQKDILSDFISLIGVGLAILAVLLAIIQLAYKRLNIIRLVIANTFFAPLVYYGLCNVLIGSLNYLYHSDPIFWPDGIFVLVATTQVYLFTGFAVFLSLVFFKTFTYTNFSKITDLYLANLRRLVVDEKRENVDSDGAEFLQSAGSELKSEIDTAIGDSRITVIDKIFDFYLFVQKQNPQSNILRGIHIFLESWLMEADGKRNINVLHNLVANWRELFQSAIASRDANQIAVLRLFAKGLYTTKKGLEGAPNRKLAIDFFPIRLKELAMVQIFNAKLNEASFADIQEAYRSIEPILFELSELIKACIEEGDQAGLRACLQEIKNLLGDMEIERRASEIEQQLYFVKHKVPGFDMPDGRTLYRYDLHLQFEGKKFSIVFGNLSWIYFQIMEKKESYNSRKEAIDILLQYLNLEDKQILARLIPLIDKETELLGWNQWIWNGEERLPGEVYFLSSQQDFLVLGLIVLMIRKNLLTIPVGDYELSIIRNMRTLTHWINTVLQRYPQYKQGWSTLFGVEEVQVDELLQKIIAYTKEIDLARESITQAELAEAPLSPSMVTNFQQKIFKQWSESNTLSRVFEFFNSTDHDPDGKLVYAGMMRIHFEKAKFMFTEEQHHEIHGIEWGYEVNTQVNRLFVTRIKESGTPVVLTDSFIDGMETAIKVFAKRKAEKEKEKKEKEKKEEVEVKESVRTQLVMFHSLVSGHEIIRALEGSGNFKVSTDMPVDTYPFAFTGVYRNEMVLVPLRSSDLKNSFVILSLPDTALLERREDPKWMDKLLQVDVIEVDDTNAQRLAEKKYPGKEISQQLINEMLSGIFIEINETLDFKIKEPESISWFQLNRG